MSGSLCAIVFPLNRRVWMIQGSKPVLVNIWINAFTAELRILKKTCYTQRTWCATFWSAGLCVLFVVGLARCRSSSLYQSSVCLWRRKLKAEFCTVFTPCLAQLKGCHWKSFPAFDMGKELCACDQWHIFIWKFSWSVEMLGVFWIPKKGILTY